MSEPPKARPSFFIRLLKWLFFLIVILVLAFLGVGMFVLDGKFDVQREIVIKAPPEGIHKQVGDLREWPNWLPFTKPKYDDTVKVTVEQPTGVGANEHWTSKNGNGELKFTASDEKKGIEYDMLFDKKYASKGTMVYTPAGADTRVTWRMTGQNEDFMGRWMALLMAPMVGPMFEEGLSDLKAKVEAK